MTARLSLQQVSKHFGGIAAADRVTLDFAPGSLSAVIGPNGAGKTTLFNLIAGRLTPDSGRILLDGDDIAGIGEAAVVRRGVARAFQIAGIFPRFTVADAMAAAVLAQQRRLHHAFRRFPPPAAQEQARAVIELVGLGHCAGQLAQHLSHGDQKLLDIALALALEPKVLLLDEPTAGMGREERRQMIERIHALWQRRQMTLVFIEHDMDIVFQIAQSVRVLVYGKVLAEGTPAEVRANPAVIDAYLGTAPP